MAKDNATSFCTETDVGTIGSGPPMTSVDFNAILRTSIIDICITMAPVGFTSIFCLFSANISASGLKDSAEIHAAGPVADPTRI